MKSEIPSSSRNHNEVEIALIQAARENSTGPNPTFRDEIDWRIGHAKNTMNFLACVFDQANFHDFDLNYEHLHGVATLLLAELRTIEILHTALQETFNGFLKGEVQL
ncbi:MAG: hypothetical protein KDJ22_04800 [Candidatus Competibacteraceae bacterium]|nr:hypothetical protein [Candidatus Competibacteraceae bacterium]MCP5127255.1 hypothetical protein [Gammaproteobacteria bacterium]HRX72266.1 hypothetical protein [Candidatus Competibacteraceae bacterium]